MDIVEGCLKKLYLSHSHHVTDTVYSRYASRISNNRFCIFIFNKSIVDEIVKKYSTIELNKNRGNTRRFVLHDGIFPRSAQPFQI